MFSDFLNLSATIWRSIGFSINEYGEVLPIDDTQQASTKIRIDPYSSKGLTILFQGQVVEIQNKIFAESNVDIHYGDIIKVTGTNEQHQVLVIEKLYGKDSLHHYEILSRRIDLL